MEIKDELPLDTFNKGILKIIQDFLAPFVKIMKVNFRLHYSDYVDDFSHSRIRLNARISSSNGNKIKEDRSITIQIEKQIISSIRIYSDTKDIEAVWVD